MAPVIHLSRKKTPRFTFFNANGRHGETGALAFPSRASLSSLAEASAASAVMEWGGCNLFAEMERLARDPHVDLSLGGRGGIPAP